MEKHVKSSPAYNERKVAMNRDREREREKGKSAKWEYV